MDRTRIWSRMGRWFKAAETPSDPTAPSGDDGSGHGDSLPFASDLSSPETAIEPKTPASSRFRLSRTNAAIERLEKEYGRVVGLIESVQTHMERQGERSEVMAGALTRLAESLDHLPDASTSQLGMLSKISEQLDVDAACAIRIEEGLSQLPSLADAQREAMVAVARQVETSRESTERVADSLDVCQQSMAQLGDATMATERAATQLYRDTSARDERLASILQEQTRRLTLFAYAALTLAVVAVVVGVVALTR